MSRIITPAEQRRRMNAYCYWLTVRGDEKRAQAALRGERIS